MNTTAVKERPIVFTGDSVVAIISGRKTQTRRVMKPQPTRGNVSNSEGWHWDPTINDHHIWHDDEDQNVGQWSDWFRAMCPFGVSGERLLVHQSAAELTLEITDVRVQRLQEISKRDVICEGIEGLEDVHAGWHQPFAELWDKLNAKRGFGWDTSPWVWAISFKVLQ